MTKNIVVFSSRWHLMHLPLQVTPGKNIYVKLDFLVMLVKDTAGDICLQDLVQHRGLTNIKTSPNFDFLCQQNAKIPMKTTSTFLYFFSHPDIKPLRCFRRSDPQFSSQHFFFEELLRSHHLYSTGCCQFVQRKQRPRVYLLFGS